MLIRKINDSDIPALIQFNKEAYPDRNATEESVNYRLFRNPYYSGSHETLIAVEGNEIIGQIMMMPTEFRHGGKKYCGYWGMSYFVNESFRGTPAGTILCKRATKIEHHFGLGFSEQSLKIHLVFREKIVGYMAKMIRINNIISVVKSVRHNFHSKYDFLFPAEIESNENRFIKINHHDEIRHQNGFWNNDVLEFIRDKKFMEWRFFYYPGKYFFYKLIDSSAGSKNPVYFVVRPIVWKRMNCLLLVDYRFNLDNPDEFANIINAVNKLSSDLNLAASITGCSLPGLLPVLKKNRFYEYGKRSEVVTGYNLSRGFSSMDDTVFVTFADSDNDFYYGDDKW